MKFAVGYQCINIGSLFSEIIFDYKDKISEVYFSYPQLPSGRPENSNFLPDVIEQTEYELEQIQKMNISLDLLINGNCYGQYAISEKFELQIFNTLQRLEKCDILPKVVTTTTPFAASVVKKYYPSLEVRASVNMKIDSIIAMEYLKDKFDSFYLRRDLQRNLDTVKKFSAWCKDNGKKLCLLANSGCLRNCPYQTFHDNLVAHNNEIKDTVNVKDFLPHLCWDRYQDKNNIKDFLKATWIRPEDVSKYEPYVDCLKLATRNTSAIRLIISAYTNQSFDGNLLDLTEPCFSGKFAPYILNNKSLDNVLLPNDCANNCNNCGKCEEIINQALIKMSL